MSGDVMKWALKQQLPKDTKFVLICLANHANKDEDHRARPGKKLLATETGMCKRTVDMHIRRLQDRGLIVIDKRYRYEGGQSSNYYTFNYKGEGANMLHPPRADHAAPPPCKPTCTPYERKDERKDERKSTGKPGPEDLEVKTHDVLADNTVKKKEDIIEHAFRKGNKLIPAGCAYIWREFRRTAGAAGFQGELLKEELSMLSRACKRVGDEKYINAVWAVMENWMQFAVHANQTAGAYQIPKRPKVWFFTKYIEAAVEFAQNKPAEIPKGFVQVVAKPDKPLTKPVDIEENTPNTMTHEEILEINKEFDD